VNSVVEEIIKKEPLITSTKIDKVKELIESNKIKIETHTRTSFELNCRITGENCSSR